LLKSVSKILFLISVSLLSVLYSCDEASKHIEIEYPENPYYNFEEPNKIWELPGILKEISGIVVLNDSTMLCQQDEKGYLFFFNLEKKQIAHKIRFGNDGDYEDVSIANNKIYILKSNGWIYEIDKNKPDLKPIIFKTGLSLRNNTEGLCFDESNNSLLIACKNKTGIKNAIRYDKAVYAFDLTSKKLSEEPFLHFNLKDFSPSAISIHPLTKHIFMLSTSKKKIIEFSNDGKILYANRLKHSRFKQPEGLCFSKNGDLYISNEGKSGKANILQFKIK
jgi:hypothetical protein